VGMLLQTIEQVGLWNEDDCTLRIRNRFRGLWLIVENCDIGERASRPEHFQHLFAAPRRANHGPHAAGENDAESFGWVAPPEDPLARLVAAFPQACHQRPNVGWRRRA